MRATPVEGERIRIMRIIARMNVGGPALQVTNLMEHLDSRRFDQILVTGYVGSDEADFIDLRAPHLEAQRIQGLGRSPNALGDVRAFASLAKAIHRFRPHIVHTHTAKAGTLGRVAARLAGHSRIVHTYHGHLLHGYFSPLVTGAVVRTERALARISSRLVAVGEQVRDDLLAARIGRQDQYVVVPPGIPLGTLPEPAAARAELGLPSSGPVVAIVARLAPIKRVDRFIDMAVDLAGRRPDASFIVCGDGDLLPTLSRSAAPLADRIRFLGWRPDVETIYAACDVVVLSSDNEGTPVSLIEAGLAARPSVATRVGSVAEVINDGVTGLLAESSPSALASAVDKLLNDPSMRARMGNAAKTHTQSKFGPDRLVTDTERLYEDVMHPVKARR
jgi:glycosyltransferase involved in cell wall biosynthesis